ncbi:MAG: HpcH/HpaI aldolase/citrate lyase family protein [Betaproteobacteria bacterium]|nr:HpcH/HpaI aldolase/citrate lyase family protein [Betaproteobacteria bacterium]
MEMPVNQFKRALKEGKPQIGIWSSLSSHIVAEVLAGAGFDWVLLDTEHSPNEVPMVQAQLQAMVGGTATPIVRPAWNDMVLIKRYLDIGAQTLLLPYVQSAEEAKNAVRYMRYPPHGVRGVAGSTRATGYGRIKDYFKLVHEELCLLVQVETRAALSQLDAICAVEGVDGVFIGPNDLAADLGHLGDLRHPELWRTIAGACERIRSAGKAPGILVGEADGKRCLDMGFLFVAVGADVGILARGAEALAAKFRRGREE